MAEDKDIKIDPDALTRVYGGISYKPTGNRPPSPDLKKLLKESPEVRDNFLDGAARAQQNDWDNGNHPADK